MAASMRRSAAVALLCCMAAAAYTACALPTGPDTRPRISEQVINFPGPLRSARDGVPIVDPPTRIAGYFRLNRTQDAHMFYFLFNSRSAKDDPVVLWMTGGPGCSSELAVFYENGPYSINPDLTLSETQYGWDRYHTTVFVDQPINTGFSYSDDDRDRVFDEVGVAEDMLDFMRELYAVHPELKDRPLYVTGESYAGHYVPAVSHRLWAANKAHDGVHFNLQGIAIGNGLTDPGIQFPAYADFALENKLISKGLHDGMQFWSPVCTFATKLCNSLGWGWVCSLGQGLCMSITFEPVLVANPNINVYDITKKCEAPLCYDFSAADRFLNMASTRKALGVGSREWQGCDMSVYADMSGDWLKNYANLLPEMLEDGVRVMIYAGNLDLICNWLGNSRWVEALQWSGSPLSPESDWLVLGQKAGTVRTSGPLSFVKVLDAGHMVPMDQPLNALAMITAFTRGHDLSAMSHLAHLGDDELLEVLSRPAEGLVQRREGDRQRYGRRGGAKAGQGQALGLPRVLGLGRGQGPTAHISSRGACDSYACSCAASSEAAWPMVPAGDAAAAPPDAEAPRQQVLSMQRVAVRSRSVGGAQQRPALGGAGPALVQVPGGPLPQDMKASAAPAGSPVAAAPPARHQQQQAVPGSGMIITPSLAGSHLPSVDASASTQQASTSSSPAQAAASHLPGPVLTAPKFPPQQPQQQQSGSRGTAAPPAVVVTDDDSPAVILGRQQLASLHETQHQMQASLAQLSGQLQSLVTDNSNLGRQLRELLQEHSQLRQQHGSAVRDLEVALGTQAVLQAQLDTNDQLLAAGLGWQPAPGQLPDGFLPPHLPHLLVLQHLPAPVPYAGVSPLDSPRLLTGDHEQHAPMHQSSTELKALLGGASDRLGEAGLEAEAGGAAGSSGAQPPSPAQQGMALDAPAAAAAAAAAAAPPARPYSPMLAGCSAGIAGLAVSTPQPEPGPSHTPPLPPLPLLPLPAAVGAPGLEPSPQPSSPGGGQGQQAEAASGAGVGDTGTRGRRRRSMPAEEAARKLSPAAARKLPSPQDGVRKLSPAGARKPASAGRAGSSSGQASPVAGGRAAATRLGQSSGSSGRRQGAGQARATGKAQASGQGHGAGQLQAPLKGRAQLPGRSAGPSGKAPALEEGGSGQGGAGQEGGWSPEGDSCGDDALGGLALFGDAIEQLESEERQQGQAG